MNFTDRRIIESFTGLFDSLSLSNKTIVMENLSKALNTKVKDKDKPFYKSFGAFASAKSAEESVKEIRTSRKFRRKEISF